VSTPRCAVCHGEVFRPVVAWGRTFCEIGCAHYFQSHHPAIVESYNHAYPLSARRWL
jgi:fructosamine-3-kinase